MTTSYIFLITSTLVINRYVLFCSYTRCTRSVSIVSSPPAYYAHLAAFRARFCMEPELSDGGSVTSGSAAGRGGAGGGGRTTRALVPVVAVRPLPALKDNVKKVLFYC
ncbi:hypothetical protein ACFE04_004396 [Oxalis oulophora]